MKQSVFATVLIGLVLGLGGQARGADIVVPGPLPDPSFEDRWTGFKAGVFAGYADGESDIRSQSVNGQPVNAVSDLLVFSSTFGAPATVSSFSDNGSGNAFEDESFVGSGKIGYDKRVGQFVFGIEGDFAGLDISDAYSASIEGAVSSGILFSGFLNVGSIESELDWLATVRGRAGYLLTPNLLVFATGGAAFSEMDVTLNTSTTVRTTTTSRNSSDQKSLFGFAVGGGVETEIFPRLFLTGEYLYVQFQDQDFDLALEGSTPGIELGTDIHVARIGLSYKFSVGQ